VNIIFAESHFQEDVTLQNIVREVQTVQQTFHSQEHYAGQQVESVTRKNTALKIINVSRTHLNPTDILAVIIRITTILAALVHAPREHALQLRPTVIGILAPIWAWK